MIVTIGKWIIRHKFATFCGILTLVLAIEFLTLPSFAEIRELGKKNPRITALMKQRMEDAKERKKPYSIKQQWVPLSQISEHLLHAVIVAEDGTFYEHDGIDWFEVKEPIKKDIEKGRFARGGSTITQQLSKNLYLSTSKDPIRKLKEIVIASWIEDRITKERILEIYMNCIEWGDGIFGVEAAALSYFGKHAAEIDRDEAARLAAAIPSPLKHKPNVDDRFITYRKAVILGRLDGRGW